MEFSKVGWEQIWDSIGDNSNWSEVEYYLTQSIDDDYTIIDEYGDELTLGKALRYSKAWHSKDSMWYAYFPIWKINRDEKLIMLCYERMS